MTDPELPPDPANDRKIQAPRKRMRREQRRELLLDTAAALVRSEGASALTLVTLAHHAGIAKPVVYSQFGTRQGLLAQLYERYDGQIVASIRQSLRDRPASLEEAVHTVAASYVDAFVAYGAEYDAIVAALMAYPEHTGLMKNILDYFVRALDDIFLPFIKLDERRRIVCLTMIFGAIDQTARAVENRLAARDLAVEILTSGVLDILRRGA